MKQPKGWRRLADSMTLALVAGAGIIGGAMNALAGGGTFATLPALLAIGLPANVANATSNVALMPGAAASAWAFRDELGPVGGLDWKLIAAVTFVSGLAGSLLLVITPARTFDVIIPWLVLYAFVLLAFGKKASDWLAERTSIGPGTLIATQILLGIYGGYFGGGVGLMMTATYGLLAGLNPRAMFAPRTLMLAVANFAAAFVFIGFGMVDWTSCLAMLVGSIIGGWAGAHFGKRLPHGLVRAWTLSSPRPPQRYFSGAPTYEQPAKRRTAGQSFARRSTRRGSVWPCLPAQRRELFEHGKSTDQDGGRRGSICRCDVCRGEREAHPPQPAVRDQRQVHIAPVRPCAARSRSASRRPRGRCRNDNDTGHSRSSTGPTCAVPRP